MDSEEIDLSNVDYDDVLNLYRGWRRSEGALKEKNKELNTLKERMKHLQDSHVKFRSQIQALESVKELTINLQTQLSILQQENNQLNQENRRVLEQKREADEMLAMKTKAEIESNKILRDLQQEFGGLRAKYSDITYAQRNLEAAMAQEVALRSAAEARAQAAADIAENYRRELRDMRAQLDTAENRMAECDLELTRASEQLKSLSGEVASMAEVTTRSKTAEAEASVLKGDIARLLRLLEHYPAAKKFIRHWQDSQGMNFMGMGAGGGGDGGDGDALFQNTGRSSNFSLDSGPEDEEVMAADWDDVGIHPNDLAHLKRVHSGGDTFPMTANIEEELKLWAPGNVTAKGLKFWSSKMPHTPKEVIMDFIRSMNTVWLRRERRKLRRMQDHFDQCVSDLKRQIAHSKPYNGVLAERQIRRLQSQVLGQTKKKLTGKAKSKLDVPAGELLADCDSDEEAAMVATIPPHHRRPCQQVKVEPPSALQAASIAATLQDLSAKKFLEVSLNSLENMGRQQHQRTGSPIGADAHGGGGAGSSTAFMNSTRLNLSNLSGGASSGVGGISEETGSATEAYVKGALWIGRNLVVVAEDVLEKMTEFRVKFLSEVANAAHDSDPRRSSHRLNILATSGIDQALKFVDIGRNRTRSILQGLDGLNVHDYNAVKAFSRSLPIEAALAPSTGYAGASTSQHQHHGSFHGAGASSTHGHGQPHYTTPIHTRDFGNASTIGNFSRN